MLVLSPEVINDNATVIIVAPLTSKKTDRIYPFEALVEAEEGGIPLRSKVMLLHIRGIDKRRVTGSYGSVGTETMQRVDAALRIATGLADV